MQWDLGSRASACSWSCPPAGVVAQLVVGSVTTRWLWFLVAVTYFVSGLFISEVWFGWATEAELQPNIDGLSFDEVLIGLPPTILVVVVAWYVTRRSRAHRPVSP